MGVKATLDQVPTNAAFQQLQNDVAMKAVADEVPTIEAFQQLRNELMERALANQVPTVEAFQELRDDVMVNATLDQDPTLDAFHQHRNNVAMRAVADQFINELGLRNGHSHTVIFAVYVNLHYYLNALPRPCYINWNLVTKCKSLPKYVPIEGFPQNPRTFMIRCGSEEVEVVHMCALLAMGPNSEIVEHLFHSLRLDRPSDRRTAREYPVGINHNFGHLVITRMR